MKYIRKVIPRQLLVLFMRNNMLLTCSLCGFLRDMISSCVSFQMQPHYSFLAWKRTLVKCTEFTLKFKKFKRLQSFRKFGIVRVSQSVIIIVGILIERLLLWSTLSTRRTLQCVLTSF